jgi:hypothetical protein
MKTTLPTDSQARKDVPLYSGCFAYFPAALAGVARWSKLGNDKHNPGQPLHHARGKSMDHADCILRHTMDLSDMLADFARRPEVLSAAERQAILDEADARAWRALADSQELHERFGEAPLAPAARLPNPPEAIAKSPGQTDVALNRLDEPVFKKASWLCPHGDCCLPVKHGGPHVDLKI